MDVQHNPATARSREKTLKYGRLWFSGRKRGRGDIFHFCSISMGPVRCMGAFMRSSRRLGGGSETGGDRFAFCTALPAGSNRHTSGGTDICESSEGLVTSMVRKSDVKMLFGLSQGSLFVISDGSPRISMMLTYSYRAEVSWWWHPTRQRPASQV